MTVLVFTPHYLFCAGCQVNVEKLEILLTVRYGREPRTILNNRQAKHFDHDFINFRAIHGGSYELDQYCYSS